jgi:RES domain-containing protein
MGRGGLMLLWRLSAEQYANNFDGGYGLLFDGRWNTMGHAVTYCASSPSLCVLEKLVHIEDPALLPDLVMVTYDVPERTDFSSIGLDQLPKDWRRREGFTQLRGDVWHRSRSTLLLKVPSAIVPLKDSPDVNVMINHNHPGVIDIKICSTEPFALDQRLL